MVRTKFWAFYDPAPPEKRGWFKLKEDPKKNGELWDVVWASGAETRKVKHVWNGKGTRPVISESSSSTTTSAPVQTFAKDEDHDVLKIVAELMKNPYQPPINNYTMKKMQWASVPESAHTAMKQLQKIQMMLSNPEDWKPWIPAVVMLYGPAGTGKTKTLI